MPQLRVELEPVTREKVAPGEVRLRATFTSELEPEVVEALARDGLLSVEGSRVTLG